MRSRPVRDDALLARRSFTLWWFALSAGAFVSGLAVVLGAFGLVALPLHVGLFLLTILFLHVALFGLVHYLTYLFLNGHPSRAPLLALYAGSFMLTVLYVVSGDPSGVEVGAWHVSVAYGTPQPGALRAFLAALLVVPQTAGALLYATLLRKTDDPGARYRIALVSTGIVAWSIATYFRISLADTAPTALQLGLRSAALAGVLLVFAAYRPPHWVRSRLDSLAA